MTRADRVHAVVTADGAATITLGGNVHQLQAATAREAMTTVVGLVIEEAQVTRRPLEFVAQDHDGTVTGFYVDADGVLVEDPTVVDERDAAAGGPIDAVDVDPPERRRPSARLGRPGKRAVAAIAAVAVTATLGLAIAAAGDDEAGDQPSSPTATSTAAAQASSPAPPPSTSPTSAPTSALTPSAVPITVRASSPRPRQLTLVIRGLQPGVHISIQLQPAAGKARVVDLVADAERVRWPGKGLAGGPLAWTVAVDAQPPLVGTVRIKTPPPPPQATQTAPAVPQPKYTPAPSNPGPRPPKSGHGPRGPIAE